MLSRGASMWRRVEVKEWWNLMTTDQADDSGDASAGTPTFPRNWQIAADYDPNQHLMNLKGRDYLNVQNRLLWFIRDQRAFIAAGLARVPYVIRTELVAMDRDAGWAHFRTYVCDVLGNEATMYGSESASDFGDFAEKASTKSLGRALLTLGYGTAFAPEMDEGDRVVDAPIERARPTPLHNAPQRTASPRPMPQRPPTRAAANPTHNGHVPAQRATGAGASASATGAGYSVAGWSLSDAPSNSAPASDKQMESLRKLCEALGCALPPTLDWAQAGSLIKHLSTQYATRRQAAGTIVASDPRAQGASDRAAPRRPQRDARYAMTPDEEDVAAAFTFADEESVEA